MAQEEYTQPLVKACWKNPIETEVVDPKRNHDQGAKNQRRKKELCPNIRNVLSDRSKKVENKGPAEKCGREKSG